MKRVYEYKCLACGAISEHKHGINEVLFMTFCTFCKKETPSKKLISKSTFKIGWNTDY